jgi:predicted transcriptional regulator
MNTARPVTVTLVKEVMVRNVSVVTADMKLWQVAELFIAKGFSGAPVVDNAHKVISIIGEGLVMRLAATEGLEATIRHCLPKMPQAHQMVMISSEYTFTEAYKLFLKHNIHRLPVIDSTGKLQGMITRGTILKIFVEAHYGKKITPRK